MNSHDFFSLTRLSWTPRLIGKLKYMYFLFFFGTFSYPHSLIKNYSMFLGKATYTVFYEINVKKIPSEKTSCLHGYQGSTHIRISKLNDIFFSQNVDTGIWTQQRDMASNHFSLKQLKVRKSQKIFFLFLKHLKNQRLFFKKFCPSF